MMHYYATYHTLSMRKFQNIPASYILKGWAEQWITYSTVELISRIREELHNINDGK